jgi:predicted metal-dependent hydrolase
MDLNYTIVRSSRRKKLTITVERDKAVVVHAPAATTEEFIAQVVQSKRQWLFDKLNHPQKYQDLPHAPGKEVVNGESALYLGQEYPVVLTSTASGGVEFSGEFLIPPANQLKRRVVLKDWYVARAQREIALRVNRHAHELGVTVAEVNIVENRFSWGSCTTKDHVNFNWRLIKAPMFVIDYVIVHELAHLLEANHTPRFWNIVRTKAPLAEKAKAWLKGHGQLLEEEI